MLNAGMGIASILANNVNPIPYKTNRLYFPEQHNKQFHGLRNRGGNFFTIILPTV